MASGMSDADSWPFEKAPEWSGVDRERVNECDLVGPTQLNQCQPREVGPFGMEFSVERICLFL